MRSKAWRLLRRIGELEGWRVLDTFGFNDNLFDIERDPQDCIQPIFVLENMDCKKPL